MENDFYEQNPHYVKGLQLGFEGKVGFRMALFWMQRLKVVFDKDSFALGYLDGRLKQK